MISSYCLHRPYDLKQQRRRIENHAETEMMQFLGGEPGSFIIAFEHVGHLRRFIEAAADLFELLLAFRGFDVNPVRAGMDRFRRAAILVFIRKLIGSTTF
jgi:hypothetical protein